MAVKISLAPGGSKTRGWLATAIPDAANTSARTGPIKTVYSWSDLEDFAEENGAQGSAADGGGIGEMLAELGPYDAAPGDSPS
jgi:hypothetical protein